MKKITFSYFKNKIQIIEYFRTLNWIKKGMSNFIINAIFLELLNVKVQSNYTEHCSVWSYQFYRYYHNGNRNGNGRWLHDCMDEKRRFLRWPDGAIRKILFIFYFLLI